MILIVLFLWIIFNGRLTLETIIPGCVVSVMMFLFVCKYLGYTPDTDKKLVRFFLRGILYVATLIWETVKSNLYVSKIVYSRKVEVRPQLVFFRTDLKSVLARVVLANSITLTPGTLTVVLNDDLFCVHCLNSDLTEGINKSVFVRQLKKFEEIE